MLYTTPRDKREGDADYAAREMLKEYGYRFKTKKVVRPGSMFAGIAGGVAYPGMGWEPPVTPSPEPPIAAADWPVNRVNRANESAVQSTESIGRMTEAISAFNDPSIGRINVDSISIDTETTPIVTDSRPMTNEDWNRSLNRLMGRPYGRVLDSNPSFGGQTD